MRQWQAAALAVALAGGTAFAARDAPVADPADPYVTTTQTSGGVTQAYPWTLMLLGGVEGYTRTLSNHIGVGGTYGLALGLEPVQFLGFELGYSGAAYGAKNSSSGTVDLVRNGGYVAITPGITAWLNGTGTSSIKPYLIGGIGFDGYTATNAGPSMGFTNQTLGTVPYGAGIELRASQLVANARFNFASEFGSNEFQPFEQNPIRYQGQLSLGGAF